MENNQLIQDSQVAVQSLAESTPAADNETVVPPAEENVNADDVQEPSDSNLLQTEGQSSVTEDPNEKLLLGKFKSVDDLSKAYEELQKYQGKASEELGNLRKQLNFVNQFNNTVSQINSYKDSITKVIEHDKELYDTPEYLQNASFKEMYKEALIAYGENLDTDRMIKLLDSYVKDRISFYDKQKAAGNETQKILDSMSYSKNIKSSIQKPEKKLDEMTDEEFRTELRKLI